MISGLSVPYRSCSRRFTPETPKPDRIDLLYCHSWDDETPIEETLRAVDDLIHQGKVVYAGASNFPTWILAKGLWTSDVRNLYRFEASKVYSTSSSRIGTRNDSLCSRTWSCSSPYSPLASGMLTANMETAAKQKTDLNLGP
ncbi:MAG: hypothetical protein Ct9H300mP19_16780 [Dehalococcoidia bacterium]|nr:MAG: hypothetical protein Ct9H300mP19_16780 [Dehalococcoidia bacterium]